MSWIEKTSPSKQLQPIDQHENNFPFEEISFMRIGAAIATVREPKDSAMFVELLEKLIEKVNLPYEADSNKHLIGVQSIYWE